jgi:PIN domain nuclease of toxin-antitoxin system
MNYLLDTHTFLWFLDGHENLSLKARTAIESSKNASFISIASLWEIAIKISLKKISLDIHLKDLKQEILKNNFEILPLDFEHILELSKLQDIHKDPFDRIIISQAITEKLTIISRDSHFGMYKNVKILW